jgi:hypothetical protein
MVMGSEVDYKYISATQLILVTLIMFFTSVSVAATKELGDVIDKQVSVDKKAIQSQNTIDKLSDQTQRMLEDYKQTLRETDSLQRYNSHLENLIKSQREEITSVNNQLKTIDTTSREIVPLMMDMVDTLEQFIELDTPFLINERSERVNHLKAMMNQADVTVSEKYRRIMEAYQIENEYGRTIEAYRGTLKSDETTRAVDFLRFGRVALIYQTLDGKEQGIWNSDTHSWDSLPNEYRASITKGLRIARKQIAPDLLKLPVRAPETIQ